LQLSLFHTWRFADTILIRDGVPELDLLERICHRQHAAACRVTFWKGGQA
jgi:hypothetical protein